MWRPGKRILTAILTFNQLPPEVKTGLFLSINDFIQIFTKKYSAYCYIYKPNLLMERKKNPLLPNFKE